MSIERYSHIINATGRADLTRGNFFLLLTATAAVNVRADRDGTSEGFNGVVGGFLVRRVKPWDTMLIIGPVGTTIEYLVGSENVSEDETDIRLGVSSVAGTVSVAEAPSTTISNLAPVTVAGANEAQLFAANAARRRIRVFAAALNAGSCFVRSVSGSNFIAELQPGQVHEFKTIDETFVRNDTGVNCTFYLLEEV